MNTLNIFGDNEDIATLSEVGIFLQSLQCNPAGMFCRLSFAVDANVKAEREVQRERLSGYVLTVFDATNISIEYNAEAKSDWGKYWVSFKSEKLAVPQRRGKNKTLSQPF